MTWQIFPNVTFTNGSKNIAVNDSTATTGILAGYAVNKDNKSYEIESITSSAIILVDAWDEATTANVKIKIQPTSEPIKEYIQETLGEVKGLVADYLARLQLEESIISSTGTVQFTDSAGVIHDIPGWGNLEASMLAKMQEFGLGTRACPVIMDCDGAIYSGTYAGGGSGGENFGVANGMYGTVRVEARGNNTILQTNKYAGKIAERQSVNGGTDWSDWEEVFTTASVEYGSNANGEYWKYPDGKLICTMNATHTVAISFTMPGGYRSASQSAYFPAGFVVSPKIFATASGGIQTFGVIIYDLGVTEAKAGFMYVSPVYLGASTKEANFIAIGRWK